MLNKCCMNFKHLRARFCSTEAKSERGGRKWWGREPFAPLELSWNLSQASFSKGLLRHVGHTAPPCPFASLQPHLGWIAPHLSFLLSFEMEYLSIGSADLFHHCVYSMWDTVLCWAGWLLKIFIWDCNGLVCPMPQAICPHWGAFAEPPWSSTNADCQPRWGTEIPRGDFK